ncbi:distal tail protein Dit [Paenibacillus lautus]|uniref:Phage tail family protein n=1 Tax=Paenibacillus lautus TaxID=1401 RepID=A0A385TU57_PAELA|nr:distal tail protein Dit [Paenibacillus lautus]AYB47123.1 phage tail family protein [Paenibacillus lautus]
MSHDSVLTLDGVTPKSLGMGVFRRTQRPILSSTVDTIVTVPGMHGAYDFGATMGPKQFELECAFFAKNHIELQQRVSALAAFLLDGDGRPRTMPIIFANQPDRQYTVRYSGDLQIDRISGLGTFTLPFTAFDPFAYSKTSTSDLLTWDTDYTWEDDFVWDDGYSFDFIGPGIAEINNLGSLNAEPIIEISGSFSSLSLTVGGIVFTYNTPMSGTLVIDFKRKTAKSGTQNVLQNTNAQFGKIPPGTSNIVVGGSGLNITMELKFNFKYAA